MTNFSRSSGTGMLELIACLRALPDERRVYGLTPHANFCLLAVDTALSPWYVTITAANVTEPLIMICWTHAKRIASRTYSAFAQHQAPTSATVSALVMRRNRGCPDGLCSYIRAIVEIRFAFIWTIDA